MDKPRAKTAVEHFRQGALPLSYRRSFADKKEGRTRRYAGLYAAGRLLSTGDFLEADARVICELFNQSVTRRAKK
jgi:hypothetical protein